MAVSVVHQKVSGIADIGDATLVEPSDWNAAHTVTGLGALATLNNVTEATITLADNTTDNVSTAAHGFTPKAPNDATKFLNGTGAWSVPTGTPPYNYIGGLQLANNASNQKIDIAAGAATDSTHVTMLSLASLTTCDCTVNGAVNSLDAGTIANSTWYHLFIITQAVGASPGTLASTSATAPTLPAGYTMFRRVGAMKTDGAAHFLSFTQVDDTVYLATQILDVSVANLGTTTTNFVLTTPLGVKTIPLVRGNNSGTGTVIIMSGDETSITSGANFSAAPGFDIGASGNVTARARLHTDTSSQVKASGSAANQALHLVTRGWIDSRGAY